MFYAGLMTAAPMPQTIDETFARREELLDEWVRLGRDIAALEARRSEVLADRLDLMVHEHQTVLPGPNEMSFRSMTAEFAAAGHVPQGTVECQITDAWMLVRRFPETHAALAAGRISRRHAEIIVTAAPRFSDVDDADSVATEYESQVLPFAEHDTAARTRIHARGVTGKLCPETLAEQHSRARSERAVSVRPVGDGLAALTVITLEVLAYAAHDRLTTIADNVVKARPEGRRRPMTATRRVREAAAAAARAAQEPTDPTPPSHPGTLSVEHGGESDAPWMTESGDVGPADGWAVSPDGETAPADSGAESDNGGAESANGGATPTDNETTDPGPTDEELELLASSTHISSDDAAADPVGELIDHDSPDTVWRESLPIDDGFGASDGDTRTMDQLRADILTDLLLTAIPSAVTSTGLESVRATVNVTVAATTLAGEDERMSEFEGHGPMLPDVSRILAGRSTSWNRVFLDPRGMVVETDNYVPTAEMKRFLRARDQHCRFPGCRAPAQRCQIDHNRDYAKGGKTANCNLCLFCTSHHPLKHPDVAERDRWTAQQLDDGVILWTSPLGRVYGDEPPLRVMFT